MPNSPQPQHRDWPAVTEADLAALLAGKVGTAPGLRPVADLLAALTAEATTGELAGEAGALAAFRRRAAGPAPWRVARWTPARLVPRLGAKVAAAATAAAVVLGGAATAAYANVLPAPIQRFAHETIGAPTPHPGPGPLSHGGPAGLGRQARGGRAAHGPHAQERPGPPGTTPSAQGSQGGQGAGNHGNSNGQGSQGGAHARQDADQGQQSNGQGQGGTGQSRSARADPVGLYWYLTPRAQTGRVRTAACLAPRLGRPAYGGLAWATNDFRTRPTPRVRCGGGAVGRVAGLAVPGSPLTPPAGRRGRAPAQPGRGLGRVP